MSRETWTQISHSKSLHANHYTTGFVCVLVLYRQGHWSMTWSSEVCRLPRSHIKHNLHHTVTVSLIMNTRHRLFLCDVHMKHSVWKFWCVMLLLILLSTNLFTVFFFLNWIDMMKCTPQHDAMSTSCQFQVPISCHVNFRRTRTFYIMSILGVHFMLCPF